jgi:GNAT superfamily N-acetyltransferase
VAAGPQGETGPWTVRRASVTDSTALAALAELRWAWRNDERGERGLPWPEFSTAFVRWCQDHRETHLGFLAEAGSAPIGMAWLATIERIPGPAVWTRRAGHLQSVYVLPEHRNGGIGAALVTAALLEARARGFDYVIVHPSERSFPLYRRAGFGETAAVLEIDLRKGREPSPALPPLNDP